MTLQFRAKHNLLDPLCEATFVPVEADLFTGHRLLDVSCLRPGFGDDWKSACGFYSVPTTSDVLQISSEFFQIATSYRPAHPDFDVSPKDYPLTDNGLGYWTYREDEEQYYIYIAAWLTATCMAIQFSTAWELCPPPPFSPPGSSSSFSWEAGGFGGNIFGSAVQYNSRIAYFSNSSGQVQGSEICSVPKGPGKLFPFSATVRW